MDMEDIFGPELNRIFGKMRRESMGESRLTEAIDWLLPLLEKAKSGHEMSHLIMAAADRFTVHPALLRHEISKRFIDEHNRHYCRNLINRNCRICFIMFYPAEHLALEINKQ